MGLFDSGILGGLGGLIMGDDPRQGMLQDAANAYRPQLNQALKYMKEQAQGAGSPLVEAQRRAALASALGAGQSMAAGARPGQAGLAARLGAQMAGRGAAVANQQAMQAKLAQQEAAQRALLAGLMGARGQEMQAAGQMAALPTNQERMLGGLLGLGQTYMMK